MKSNEEKWKCYAKNGNLWMMKKLNWQWKKDVLKRRNADLKSKEMTCLRISHSIMSNWRGFVNSVNT